MPRKAQRGPAPLILVETLDLPAARPLTADLLARRGQDVVIDAQAAQRIGAQCLQVLLAAKATWALDGHGFDITGASPDLVEAIALLGAPDLIPLPAALDA
jgi:chemotaxis protein CheX